MYVSNNIQSRRGDQWKNTFGINIFAFFSIISLLVLALYTFVSFCLIDYCILLSYMIQHFEISFAYVVSCVKEVYNKL